MVNGRNGYFVAKLGGEGGGNSKKSQSILGIFGWVLNFLDPKF